MLRMWVENAYCNDWATTCRSWVRCFLQDVFASKTPMAPTEVADLVKGMKVQSFEKMESKQCVKTSTDVV
jgi:hypothetical protein